MHQLTPALGVSHMLHARHNGRKWFPWSSTHVCVVGGVHLSQLLAQHVNVHCFSSLQVSCSIVHCCHEAVKPKLPINTYLSCLLKAQGRLGSVDTRHCWQLCQLWFLYFSERLLRPVQGACLALSHQYNGCSLCTQRRHSTDCRRLTCRLRRACTPCASESPCRQSNILAGKHPGDGLSQKRWERATRN